MPIEKIVVDTKTVLSQKRDGTPYTTKTGKPFKMALVNAKDGRTLSTCLFDEKAEKRIEDLSTGDEIELNIVKKGDFWNFNFPSQADKESQELVKKIKELTTRVDALEAKVYNSSSVTEEAPEPTAPEEEQFNDSHY